MRRIPSILAIALLSAAPAMADFKLYGSYWDTSDADETFGGGLGFDIPLGSSPFVLGISGTYYRELNDRPLRNLFEDDETGFFEDESLEVLPVDVTFKYMFPTDGSVHPWIGAGASYFFLDTTREGVDIDDETGWNGSVGATFGDREGVNFYAEAIYRNTKATYVRRDDGDIDLVDERVNVDLDGLGVNAGLVWRW